MGCRPAGTDASHPATAMAWLPGLTAPLELPDCAQLRAALTEVLGSWALSDAGSRTEPPTIRVTANRQGFRIRAPWITAPLIRRTLASTVCSLTVDLGRAFAVSQSAGVCLHAAAFATDGPLVVLTGPVRSGKSTLLTHLAATGARIYADDVLSVRPDGTGMALGLAPRLRLPLPTAVPPHVRQFIADHQGLADQRNLFLRLPAAQLQAFGTCRPVGWIVMLERQRNGAARLAPLSPGELLAALLDRSRHGGPPVVERLTTLLALLLQAGGVRLTYSDPTDAAQLLRAQADRPPSAGVSVSPVPVPVPPAVPREAAIPDDLSWVRGPGLLALELPDALAIVDTSRDRAHILNPLAAGLWQLLDEALPASALLDALCEAFPGIPADQLRTDLDMLLRDLHARGLIKPQF